MHGPDSCILKKLSREWNGLNYKNIAEKMLENFKKSCNMSVKIHFFYFHIGYFPENSRQYSEAHGEALSPRYKKK